MTREEARVLLVLLSILVIALRVLVPVIGDSMGVPRRKRDTHQPSQTLNSPDRDGPKAA